MYERENNSNKSVQIYINFQCFVFLTASIPNQKERKSKKQAKTASTLSNKSLKRKSFLLFFQPIPLFVFIVQIISAGAGASNSSGYCCFLSMINPPWRYLWKDTKPKDLRYIPKSTRIMIILQPFKVDRIYWKGVNSVWYWLITEIKDITLHKFLAVLCLKWFNMKVPIICQCNYGSVQVFVWARFWGWGVSDKMLTLLVWTRATFLSHWLVCSFLTFPNGGYPGCGCMLCVTFFGFAFY